MDEIFIFADGACSGNPGPGGWGTILKCPGLSLEKRMSGAEPGTTNNRMELTAVIAGLAALKKPCRVVVTTDSRYVVDAFEKRWLANWEKNGWRTASKQPVKNEDLWRRLRAAMQGHEVSWRWIRGHNGHTENEEADRLAVEARTELARREPSASTLCKQKTPRPLAASRSGHFDASPDAGSW